MIRQTRMATITITIRIRLFSDDTGADLEGAVDRASESVAERVLDNVNIVETDDHNFSVHMSEIGFGPVEDTDVYEEEQ